MVAAAAVLLAPAVGVAVIETEAVALEAAVDAETAADDREAMAEETTAEAEAEAESTGGAEAPPVTSRQNLPAAGRS